jgi:hypothetical protein
MDKAWVDDESAHEQFPLLKHLDHRSDLRTIYLALHRDLPYTITVPDGDRPSAQYHRTDTLVRNSTNK